MRGCPCRPDHRGSGELWTGEGMLTRQGSSRPERRGTEGPTGRMVRGCHRTEKTGSKYYSILVVLGHSTLRSWRQKVQRGDWERGREGGWEKRRGWKEGKEKPETLTGELHQGTKSDIPKRQDSDT